MRQFSWIKAIRSILLLSLLLTPCQLFALTCADLDGAYVYSQETSTLYLGFFGSQYASESIMNEYGTYGSPYSSSSVRNEYGTYGSPYSSYSANNDYTSTPPQIYKNGILIAYLTTNTYVSGGVSLAAIDLNCTFSASAPITNELPPSPPAWVAASDGTFTDKIEVSWDIVSGATSYNVYYSESLTGNKNYIDSTSGTSMNIVGATPEQVYYFWITASNADGEGNFGAYDSGYIALTEDSDTDGDGVQDKNDAFPNDPAASVDSDGDGFPDAWNDGKSESDSTTGLSLDICPYDPANDIDGDGICGDVDVNTAPTFIQGDGKVITDIGSDSEVGRSVSLQSDGKILLAGYENGHSVLVRYNTDGTLDTSFSDDGIVIEPSVSGRSVVVQEDGKILVADDLTVIRYNTDGTLDTSFSDDGIVNFAYSGGVSLTELALQDDGKILMTGPGDFGVVRYNTDGSLDISFSDDGMTSAGVTGESKSISVQDDGKILVGGTVSNGGNNDFALVRYNSDGSLDTSFSDDGIVTTDLGSNDDSAGYRMAVQSDGKILVGGSSDWNFALVRYNTDGSLDTSFSDDGIVTTAGGIGYSVALQSDGKIIVAGITYNFVNNEITDSDFALVRYNTDGSLDTSFSDDGIVTTDFSSTDDNCYSVTVQDDGKILAAGRSGISGTAIDFALVRYITDGSLDLTFSPTEHTLDSTASYTSDGPPVVMDENVQVFDNELSSAGNFDGATLTLERYDGSNSQDVFSATGTLSFSGVILNVEGTDIGVVTNGNGTLTLTFNKNATQALVNVAIQQIAYSNNSLTPPSAVQINWVFNDGNTGVQGQGGALIVVGNIVVSIDASNLDPDFDGIVNVNDNCPTIANTSQSDTDGDGFGDVCDICPVDAINDSDADGVCGDVDNCPLVANADQLDSDTDGIGDACDASDTDGDGFTDAQEVDCKSDPADPQSKCNRGMPWLLLLLED